MARARLHRILSTRRTHSTLRGLPALQERLPRALSPTSQDHRALAMVQALASGVPLEARATPVQGRASGLAWALEDCSDICLAATGRRPLSQARGTIHPTLLPTLAPGTVVPTHPWVEAQGAILHPRIQNRGPEQRQDMVAPEDGKIGSGRQALDAKFLICHHHLFNTGIMGISKSRVVFGPCIAFCVLLFVAQS